MARSLIVAAVAHAVVLAFWPSWSASDPLLNSGGERFGTTLVSLREAAPTPPGLGPIALPTVDEEASVPEDRGGDDEPEEVGPGRWDWDARGTADRIGERLRLTDPPVPSIVEQSEPTQPTRGAPTDEADSRGTRTGRDASATDYHSSRTAGRLDLDRLSAARPELSHFSPSSLILLRNPGEVEDFLRKWAGAGRRTEDSGGSVSVTIWVNESGSVEWAEVSNSSGLRDIDEIALELFNDVVAFQPAREKGVRVPVSVIYWLTFP